MVKDQRKTTDAELAILSLLAEKPMHGYQIEQTIADRGMREWTELGFSSIYYILDKLKKGGLLESRLEAAEGKGPSKQVFHLSPAGKKAWRSAALEAISTPHRTFSNFQLGLSNIHALNRAEVLKALLFYAEDLRSRQGQIQSKLESIGPNILFEAKILFDLSLKQIACEKEWVESFIQQLADMEKE